MPANYSKYYLNFLYILLLGIVCWYYNYDEVVLKKPQSVHQWRQSDCTSLSLNYFQDGMQFFKPSTHNLLGRNATSSQVAPSEIPFSYYTTAILYSVFGVHEWLLRGMHLFIFLMGIFYFYKTILFIAKEWYWAFFFSILLFTSPIIVYYGNNFLTDVSALSFAIISFYYFLIYLNQKLTRHLMYFFIFTFLAGSCKISGLILFLSILGIIIFLKFWNRIPKEFSTLFPKKYMIYALLSISPIVAWVIFARQYNLQYDNPYFSTGILPIWKMDMDFIQATVYQIKNFWMYEYFHPTVYMLFLLIFLFNLVKGYTIDPILYGINLMIAMACAIFIAMWFATLKNHDYYIINLYIFFVSNSLLFIKIIQSLYPRLLKQKILILFSLPFLLFNTHYAKEKNDFRYNSWMNSYSNYKSFYSISPFLDSLGIQPSDTVVSLPDPTHLTLYLMNVKGTTFCYNKNTHEDSILLSIHKGANYLFLCGDEIKNKIFVKPFIKYPIAQYENISVYDLSSFKNLKSISTDEFSYLAEKVSCDAEKRSATGNFLQNDSSQTLIENGDSQTNKFSRSGKHSIEIGPNSPYGFTCQFKNVVLGEYFKVRVYFRSKNNSGFIVGSFSSIDVYYTPYKESKNFISENWYLATTEFQILQSPKDSIFKIYMWNPTQETIHCDDLQIERYKPKS